MNITQQPSFLELQAAPNHTTKGGSPRKLFLLALFGLVAASLLGYHCYGPDPKHASFTNNDELRLREDLERVEADFQRLSTERSQEGGFSSTKFSQLHASSKAIKPALGDILKAVRKTNQGQTYKTLQQLNRKAPAGGDDFTMNIAFYKNGAQDPSRFQIADNFKNNLVLCLHSSRVDGQNFNQVRCMNHLNVNDHNPYGKLLFTLNDHNSQNNQISLFLFEADKFNAQHLKSIEDLQKITLLSYILNFHKSSCCGGHAGAIQTCQARSGGITNMDALNNNCLVLVDSRNWHGQMGNLGQQLGRAAVVSPSRWQGFKFGRQ